MYIMYTCSGTVFLCEMKVTRRSINYKYFVCNISFFLYFSGMGYILSSNIAKWTGHWQWALRVIFHFHYL